MIEDLDHEIEIDARGLKCPEPLILVRNKMMDMQSGEVIKIIATDPSTSWDFPNFCKFLGHQMLSQEENGEEYQYWIRKK
ncbi:MAG: sulfurtransferase TusA [Pseudomonadales bacterium]|nr:sulfurtransferase TusA [Pseudomonadales bacterium]